MYKAKFRLSGRCRFLLVDHYGKYGIGSAYRSAPERPNVVIAYDRGYDTLTKCRIKIAGIDPESI